MRSIIALCTAVALSGCAAIRSEKDHAANHPSGASAPAATPAQTDMHMMSMPEMHEKMMADHMKAMQDGMAMMGR